MYAWDKQGYANCIKSSYIDGEGLTTEATKRLSELLESYHATFNLSKRK